MEQILDDGGEAVDPGGGKGIGKDEAFITQTHQDRQRCHSAVAFQSVSTERFQRSSPFFQQIRSEYTLPLKKMQEKIHKIICTARKKSCKMEAKFCSFPRPLFKKTQNDAGYKRPFIILFRLCQEENSRDNSGKADKVCSVEGGAQPQGGEYGGG